MRSKKQVMRDVGKVLDKLIIFEKEVDSKDKYENPIKEWVEFTREWAEVRDIGGREFFSSMSENTKLKTKFTINYREDITTDMRIRFNGKVYNIKVPDNLDYSRRWLILIGETHD